MRNFSAFLVLAALLVPPCVAAQGSSRNKAAPADPAGKHRGAINALLYDAEGRILSAGEDGFLGIWDPKDNRAAERFQVSPYALTAMALRPGAAQIALAESDGLGLYRVSAWDYRLKRRLFVLRFRESVSCLTYSAAGSYLILSRSGQNAVAFLNPETGGILPAAVSLAGEGLSGSVSFAATGKSERSIIVYTASGSLSYWEIESGAELRRLAVPPGLTSPILFGGNRFLGGFESGGLVILDAVSGSVLIRDSRVPAGRLLSGGEEGAEFFRVAAENGQKVFSRLEISAEGRLETKERRVLPQEFANFSALAVRDGAAAFGAEDGAVLTWAPKASNPKAMQSRTQTRVVQAAVSGPFLGFITEDGALGFIPLDYTALQSRQAVSLENAEGFTLISGLADPEPGGGFKGAFMLWQADTAQSRPQPRFLDAQGRSVAGTPPIENGLSPKFPLRSASLLEGKALFLDSAGNLAIIDLESGEQVFTFSSAGSLDAAFLDSRRIVIARSAVSGGAPFLIVDTGTGETVPLPYSAATGFQVYRSSSGGFHGAVITGGGASVKTGVLSLDPARGAAFRVLAEAAGEDALFSMAESGGVLASTLGGDGAFLYGAGEAVPFERSPGLPVRLAGAASRFIAVDAEGSLCWHDNQTGALLALFRLTGREWVLEKPEGEKLRGAVEAAK